MHLVVRMMEMSNKHNQKYNVNHTYFDNIDTEEKAYWLGFIMADGCVYKQENTYRFQVNLSTIDINHLEKLNKAVDSTYKVISKDYRGDLISSLRYNNKEFCESLIKQGIVPRKSGREQIPQSIPENLLRHFIRGYFDGDGCLYIYPDNKRATLSFVSSLDLVSNIKTIIESIEGYVAPKAIVQRGKAYYIQVSNLDTISKMYEYLYKDCTIFLDRKKILFDSFLHKI